MKTKLILREIGRSHDGPVLGTGLVVKYNVEPLEPGEKIVVADFGGPNWTSWRILRTKNDVSGKWTGNYTTAEDALAALQAELI